jgi:gamma-glutamyltranspeptidase/glutathione hydrolase
VAEALNILEGYDLKAMPRENAEHLYLEASRLAFADRNAYLADPEYVDAPVAGMLSKEFAARRRELINPAQARRAGAGGRSLPFPERPERARCAQRQQAAPEGAHTTHLTVSDKDGNIVSYTFTIESWGGSGIVVPGYGFLLNNEMTDFDFTGPARTCRKPASVRAAAWRRPSAFRNGKPAFTIGSPGGATIITTVLQTIVNYIDLGMRWTAINAPRLSERNGMATDRWSRALRQRAGRGAGENRPQVGSQGPEEIGAANALVFNPTAP